jgi:hypothetical protein
VLLFCLQVSESVLEHPMWALSPHGQWCKGQVALAGDAAHTMPPHFAQVLNFVAACLSLEHSFVGPEMLGGLDRLLCVHACANIAAK